MFDGLIIVATVAAGYVVGRSLVLVCSVLGLLALLLALRAWFFWLLAPSSDQLDEADEQHGKLMEDLERQRHACWSS